MEDPTTLTVSSKESVFFPSLVSLELQDLKNLKGWWSNHNWQPCFPRLSKLRIKRCPNFAAFLCCRSLEDLHLHKCNQNLRISMGDDDDGDNINNSNNDNPINDFKLEEVKIDKWDYLLSTQLGGVTSIKVAFAEEMVNISEAAELLQSCRSLQKLEFSCCSKLTSISVGLDHLSLLESLTVKVVDELRFDEEAEPWRSLGHSLRSLSLCSIHKPVSLPTGWQYLTNLQDLTIGYWTNLESMPEWITSFSSLTSLVISCCRKIKSLPKAMSKLPSLQRLKERCLQNPQGDDWPKIQHIPHISIKFSPLTL